MYLPSLFSGEINEIDHFFSSLENESSSAILYGYYLHECSDFLTKTEYVKFLIKLDFLSCVLHLPFCLEPDECAQDVISSCNQLSTFAVRNLNLSIQINCFVSYPSQGTSYIGKTGSL